VNTSKKHGDDIGDQAAVSPTARPPLLIVLAVLLFAEGVLMCGVAVWLVFELLTTKATSVYGGIAIIVLAALAAVWVLATAVATLRERSWIRGAVITWQVVQIAVAVGCFQGLYADPVLGWALLVPSVVVILLVISPQVTAVTRRAERGES
jgi:hypothetical protein